MSAAGDEIYYQLSKESIYDAFQKIYKAKSQKEENRLVAEKDKIASTEPDEDDPVYVPFMKELKQMIVKEMEENGLEAEFDEEEEW